MKNLKKNNLTNRLSTLNEAQSSGAVYSAVAVLPVLFSFAFLIFIAVTGLATGDYTTSNWYLYASFLIPQVAFACILVCFIKAGKTSVKEIVKLPKWYYFIIAIQLQIGLLSLSELNLWFIKLLSGVGYEEKPVLIPSMDGAGFFGVLLVIAVLPAVLEELLFRGLLLKGLKPCGELFAVLVCGALFALYHQKPEQTVYQFCCGAAFALVALKSGSVLPTMLAHFFNNAWILVMAKFSLTLDAIYLPFLIFSAFCLVLSLSVLIFVDKKRVGEVHLKEKQNAKTEIKDFLFFAVIGISTCGLSWLLSLASGL